MLGLKIHFFMKSRPTACHGTTATMFGERSERNRAYMARLLMLVQLCEKSSRAEEAWLILLLTLELWTLQARSGRLYTKGSISSIGLMRE